MRNGDIKWSLYVKRRARVKLFWVDGGMKKRMDGGNSFGRESEREGERKNGEMGEQKR